MVFLRKKYFILPIIFCTIIFVFNSIQACNVPVFQYALQNWPSDPYDITLSYDEDLSVEDYEVIDLLNKSLNEDSAYTNFNLTTINDNQSEGTQNNSHVKSDNNLVLSLKYPQNYQVRKNIWTGHPDSNIVKAILDSPARREIAGNLIKGDAIVWLLMESGSSKKDDEAAALLKNELKILEGTLKLPQPTLGNNYVESESELPLDTKIKFSLIRLSRNQSGENIFIKMLLNTESDLISYSEPIAFPVFGRGRVLYALVGPGISGENIKDACKFILGACSCQVKDLNPGIDLLMSVNWESSLDKSFLDYMIYADASSISELAMDMKPGNLFRNILIVIVLQIVIVAMIIGYILIRKKTIQ